MLAFHNIPLSAAATGTEADIGVAQWLTNATCVVSVTSKTQCVKDSQESCCVATQCKPKTNARWAVVVVFVVVLGLSDTHEATLTGLVVVCTCTFRLHQCNVRGQVDVAKLELYWSVGKADC